jgi:hypothetical protein
MSRSTTFMGLSPAATEWLLKHGEKHKKRRTIIEENFDTENEEWYVVSDKIEEYEELTAVETVQQAAEMFGDSYNLKTYKLKNGRTVVEFVQAAPWQSGPVIFLALKYVDTNCSVRTSLWPAAKILEY